MIIHTWIRSSQTNRELHLTTDLPEEALCTAAMGVVFLWDKVILSHMKRWRDLPGGHIEKGESVREALDREVMEEAWVRVVDPRLFAVSKLHNHTPRINKAIGLPYPETSYIPYFRMKTDSFEPHPLEEEVSEAKAFDLREDEVQNSRVRDVILLAASKM